MLKDLYGAMENDLYRYVHCPSSVVNAKNENDLFF